jgi:glyoxylate reductase
MTKIFITRIIPDPGLILIKKHFQPFDTAQGALDIWPHDLPPLRAELIERSRGVDGLLCLLTEKIDGELMDVIGSQLKVISSMSVGVDHIDVAAATAPGVLTDATADQAFTLMLSAARRIPEAERFLRAGKWVTWQPSLLLGADFAGSTLGIVGFGRIGQAVAKRAQGFDMRVIYHDPTAQPAYAAQPVDLDTLLRESDFVSIHIPLTETTRHLVNAEFLAKMKPNAVLVNTSRGGVLDQTALHHALKSNQIFAAALDVTCQWTVPYWSWRTASSCRIWEAPAKRPVT